MLEVSKKCCATCQYGILDDLKDRICVKDKSKKCADWVKDYDCCKYWEEKTIRQVDEADMKSLKFGILCNFERCCGIDRALEAERIFSSMMKELLTYRVVFGGLKDGEIGRTAKE